MTRTFPSDLTLRDYIAITASDNEVTRYMTDLSKKEKYIDILTGQEEYRFGRFNSAIARYRFADAMLKAREYGKSTEK
jgi:hypothetical protein